MKKLLYITLLLPLALFSQVGINTTTPQASSMLDVTATDKGILIPRISIPNLAAAAPVTSPATSLLVYNTNATSGIGFYYWNGNLWAPFTGTNNWTNSGANIYNNNTGNVGVGTATPTTKLHVENPSASTSLLSQNFETNAIAPLTSSGSVWTTQTLQKNAGTYAAKSGVIGNSATSSMSSATITVPAGGGTLSFYLRVSSEANYDYLRFYIDGVQQNQWSGTVGWTQQTYTLAAGSRTLRWDYVKDSSNAVSEDAAYVDDISLSVLAPAALRIVDGNQGAGKTLVSDASGNATWQQITASSLSMPELVFIQDLEIPICSSVIVGSTGNYVRTIKGVSTTVTWTVLQRQTSSAVAAGVPLKAERLQVQYDFSPQLPFVPSGFMFSPYNNSSYPDTFSLNYALKSQNSLTMNITRSDVLGDTSAACWTGQFYFDAIIMN